MPTPTIFEGINPRGTQTLIPCKDVSAFPRSEQAVLGAVNLNRGDVDHTFIKGTARTNDNYPFPIPFVIGDRWKISFDIEDSANFATSNGIGMKFICATSTDASDFKDFGNIDGHYEYTFTISANSSDKPRLYVFISNAETNANATLKVKNLCITYPGQTGYTAPAMTNKELTEKVFVKGEINSSMDLDDIKETGIYKITSAPTHSPEGISYCGMIVQKNSDTNVRQIVFTGSVIYLRNGGQTPFAWNNWVKFTGTVVS